MNIYKVTNKNIRKYLIEFGKTYYGRLTFTVSYGSTFILLIWGLLLMKLAPEDINILIIFISMMCIMMISMLLGTKHFYNELKEYVKEEKK